MLPIGVIFGDLTQCITELLDATTKLIKPDLFVSDQEYTHDKLANFEFNFDLIYVPVEQLKIVL